MLDPLLLRTFLLISQGNSFSEASRKLALRQSTVSDHIRRLEECLGRRLFIRDTHSIVMTPEGEALVDFARSIIETNERAERFFAGTKLRGKVRFGASEDLVAGWLPSVLKTFGDNHPEIDLEYTIALSSTLISRYEAGDLDAVLCKRWPGEQRGQVVWRDRFAWAAARGTDGMRGDAVQLILYPPPAITRSLALSALQHAGVPWRIACTSDSLNGVVSATQAGLGITPLARSLIPPGLVEIEPNGILPPIGEVDFILLRLGTARAPVAELCAAILAKGRAI
ncbi:MAG: LysR family transcriptional regulator [Beijerinckiaceae bacterium]|jgi:DNA-binding transcriptional LysR family regulator